MNSTSFTERSFFLPTSFCGIPTSSTTSRQWPTRRLVRSSILTTSTSQPSHPSASPRPIRRGRWRWRRLLTHRRPRKNSPRRTCTQGREGKCAKHLPVLPLPSWRLRHIFYLPYIRRQALLSSTATNPAVPSMPLKEERPFVVYARGKSFQEVAHMDMPRQ